MSYETTNLHASEAENPPEPVEEFQARGRSEASGAFSTGNRQRGQHQGPDRRPVRPGSLPLGEEEGCSFTARAAARNDILVDYGCIGSRNNLSAVIRMFDPQQSTRRSFQLPTSMLEAVPRVRGNLQLLLQAYAEGFASETRGMAILDARPVGPSALAPREPS